jgi:D-threo-aldose 1-dehydrogenase
MESALTRLGLGVGRLGAAASSRRAGVAEAFAAIALAADAGVRLVDCPPVPETAERTLGEVLPREPAFEVVIRAADVEGGPGAVVRRLRTSLRRLKLERASAVLARASHVTGEDGDKLWTALLKLRDEGLIGAVGLAACVCDDPAGLARRFRPDMMQLPLSLLDQRVIANGALAEVAERGVEVHLRSVFLHGLLFFEEAGDAGISPLQPHVSRLRRVLAEAGADPMQAALAFALSRPEARRVVVSVGAAAELRAVLRAAAARGPALDWEALRVDAGCPAAPARCLAA